MNKKYDLVVLGTGPAGEKAAVKAAYFGYKVAIVEKDKEGGACVLLGTPSKALRETALYLSGKLDKGIFGVDRVIPSDPTVENFLYRKNYIIKRAADAVLKNLKQHKVDLYRGIASFVDPHHIKIENDKTEVLEADNVIIATGAYSHCPPEVQFDGKKVHTSDSILDIKWIPKSIAILGAGVIGCEYATIFAAMGTKVYLINETEKILPFLDNEMVNCMLHRLKGDKIDLLFNEKVTTVKKREDENAPLEINLKSGRTLHVDMLLFTAGRFGNTKELGLDKIGISVTERETIPVNNVYQTKIPHIYAVGDVIGFPALASIGMDQGRVAVAHIFQTKDIEEVGRLMPFAIYTIPELSTVGISEEEAKEKGINYCIGIAFHKDMPRGLVMGTEEGMLKLIFTKDDLIIRGVHIFGILASELIHHGIQLIESKKTLLDVIGNTYNYPSFHELYKYAAYDGLGNLSGHKLKI